MEFRYSDDVLDMLYATYVASNIGRGYTMVSKEVFVWLYTNGNQGSLTAFEVDK